MPESHAVRGGSVWADEDGRRVIVRHCRTVKPMGGVRPHSDLRWRIAAWHYADETALRTDHESDFREKFTWVAAKEKEAPSPAEGESK